MHSTRAARDIWRGGSEVRVHHTNTEQKKKKGISLAQYPIFLASFKSFCVVFKMQLGWEF